MNSCTAPYLQGVLSLSVVHYNNTIYIQKLTQRVGRGGTVSTQTSYISILYYSILTNTSNTYSH